jgi:hypothetical protein
MSVHTRRRPTSIHICPDMSDNSSSWPDTPVAALESHELRALRKNYEAATKMLEISCRVVAKYIGREADEETVLAAIKEILQEDVLTSFLKTANIRVIPDPFLSFSMRILNIYLPKVASVLLCTIKVNVQSLLPHIFCSIFETQWRS